MKERSRSEAKRINNLFESIQRGDAAYVAYRNIDPLSQQEERALEDVNERKVLTVISNIVGVTAVQKKTPNGEKDLRGSDTIVCLSNELGEIIPEVQMYIKLENSGFKSFKKALVKRFQLEKNAVDRWLWEQRYILIDGLKNEESITESFYSQLEYLKSPQYPTSHPWLSRNR